MSAGNLRNLGQTFQRQGQLDLAFETYRRCPLDAATMELLYFLGNDFEKRAQVQKASNVYAYIATRDPNYRDLRSAARAREGAAAHARRTADAAASRNRAHRRSRDAAVRSGYGICAAPPRACDAPRRSAATRSSASSARARWARCISAAIRTSIAWWRSRRFRSPRNSRRRIWQEARARFFREAEMAGRLNHPAIVTVYDAGEDQGLAYIAMEYLRGTHLSHFTEAARILPFKNTMLLVARVADALYYAHRQNVVHRDIKPANIMFNPDTDELKITDFGIARLTDTSRTKTGIVLGTPSFMSPEQLEGRPLDGRSDQFALGISLYQLLCGQLPFRAESMPRLMQKIATEPHASVRAGAARAAGVHRSDPDAHAREVGRRPLCALRRAGERAARLRRTARDAAQPAQAKHEWLIP